MIASPRGAVGTYPRLLDHFRGQSKIPSDNTVHKEEIPSPLRQTPPTNYRPTNFIGLSTWGAFGESGICPLL